MPSMSFGGFLGIGQRYHALPWNVLTYDTARAGTSSARPRTADMRVLTSLPARSRRQTEDMRRIREFWAEGQLSL
jgi:hypothetical protein